MSTEQKVEDLRRRMASVRRELDEDVDGIVGNVNELTTFQYYMKQYPWAMMGAAAFLGYWVVPQKYEIHSPDSETLEKLAAKNKLVVKDKTEPEEKGGVIGGIFSFLSSAVLRGAMAYAGAKVGEMFDANAERKAAGAPERPRSHGPAKTTSSQTA